MNPSIKLQAGPWCGAVTPNSAVIKATVKSKKNADAAGARGRRPAPFLKPPIER